MISSQNSIRSGDPNATGDTNMSKQYYDYASEMLKIAESQEHKQLFQPIEKLAFSRAGKEDPSEMEKEFAKIADSSSSDKDATTVCDKCHEKDCSCDKAKADDGAAADENEADDSTSDSKEAVAFSTYAVDALLKIADGLETEGFGRLSAASLILADNIVKEAKAKKQEKSKSKSKSDSKSKKMSDKEKSEKAKKDKEKSKSKSSKK